MGLYGRTCEACGAKMSPHLPRKRDSQDRLVCAGCSRREATRKVAHDSGDGKTIYHCPFDGAGNVVGRSDGTAVCSYCNVAFTVQVQPEYPAMPQTNPETGEPIDMPGMPGSQDPLESEIEPEEALVDVEVAEETEDDPSFPFQSSRYYLTERNAALDEESFIRHLAIAYADDREGVIQQVRASREQST